MKLSGLRFKVWGLMLSVALIALPLGLLAEARRISRALSAQGECYSSLNNIALALWSYRQRFDRFPPPYCMDSRGERTQSWRATILPWLGPTRDLAAEYDFDSAWNSPSNRSTSKRRPPWLNCPAQRELGRPLDTVFLMLSDLSVLDPEDIPSNAVLIIEAEPMPRDWRSPFDELTGEQLRSLKSAHPGGLGLILADGTRLRVKDTKGIRKKGGLYLLDATEVPR